SQRGPLPPSPTLRGTKGSTLPPTPLLRSGDPFPPRQRSGGQRVRHCPLPRRFAAGTPSPLPNAQGDKGFDLAPVPPLRSGDPFPPRQRSGGQRVRPCPYPAASQRGPLPPFANAQGDQAGAPIGAAAHARSSPG